MEQNAEKCHIDGVLLETESAMRNTPMAKKTRSAAKNLKLAEDECVIDNRRLVASPDASTTINLLCMTPRRSARKSVRPPLDYDDIIDHNTMMKKEKIKHINADTEVVEEQAVHKWSAAEVGRNTYKRSRKSKRRGNKTLKICEEQLEETETAAVEMDVSKNSDAAILTVTESVNKDIPQLKKETEDDETSDAKQQEKESATMDASQAKEEQKMHMSQPKENTEGNKQPSKETSPNSKISHSTETKVVLCSLDQALDKTNNLENIVADLRKENMNDLGLCPLNVMEDMDEEDHDMPSLIMLDDGDHVLNRTFDTDKSSEYQCVQLIGNSHMQQTDGIKKMVESSQDTTKAAIKLVITDENEQDIPINLKEEMLSAKKSQTLNPDDSITLRKVRRSNSTSGINDMAKKNLSFLKTVKVTAISDIDKRWDCFDPSHITLRRRRSKSLENFVSKIPKPKHYPPAIPLTPSKRATRTKLPNFTAIHQRQFNKMENLVQHIERKAVRAKELTKSAVKQPPIGSSGKNLSGKKWTTSCALAADRSRSRAVKKIVLPIEQCIPVKPELEKYQQMLPVPRKILGIPRPKTTTTTSCNPELEKYGNMLPIPRKVVEIPKPKLTETTTRNPLSSNIAKSMISKDMEIAANRAISNMAKSAFNLSTLVAKNSDNTMTNKFQDRRQRHMNMFKGRPAKENKSEFIRGVRSNRRFELQMQHRQQMNENS